MTDALYFALGLLLGLACGLVFFFWRSSALKSRLLVFEERLKNSENLREQAQQNHVAQQNLQQTQLQQHLNERFEALAGRVLDDRVSRLQELQTQGLGQMLEPFRERLKDFERKVEESYNAERSERGSLRGELNKLLELNLRMSSEAENLSRALRGDTRTQGAWGEGILENILERSGLRKGEEYIVQAAEMSLRNELGQPIRPDVIVRLPENRHLIVDSKVSLTAYAQYMNCDDPIEQEALAKQHADSVKRHIDGLAAKKYQTADQLNSPDFVILFMPLEPAFALAMRKRPEIQQEAWEKQIAIVSPTTLLVTLKMVAAIWKTERQERNALEIAERGGLLYDKFVGFVGDLEQVGRKFDEAQKSYAGAMGKLRDGKGNLLNQVELLRELGVKTNKRLAAAQTDSPKIEN